MSDVETEPELVQTLMALETRVWQALVSGDSGADDALLAQDFLGVYPDGFAAREAHVGQLDQGPTVAEFVISQTHVRKMGASYALLAYRAEYRRPNTLEWEVMLVSSIWHRAEIGWINTFSQDTPLTGIEVP